MTSTENTTTTTDTTKAAVDPGGLTATYSPEDNKLRLYSVTRLDSELYERVSVHGFKHAPAQGLFVAPMWTPERAEFLEELCGEIGDEDTSLIGRAETRAERFGDYSEHRADDAERARATVEAITEHIPFGQPILVGHHSERRARRDAERVEQNMRRAVSMWKTSTYWRDRAEGALRAAKYKERPEVRARRIKGLEADQRKLERSRAEAERFLEMWTRADVELTRERALAIANQDHIYRPFPVAEFPREAPASQYEGPTSLWSALDEGIITTEQAREIASDAHRAGVERADEWLAHIDNRLAYERALLAAQGGTPADRQRAETGGAVRCWASPGYGKGWSYVQKVNKVSVTVLDDYGNGGPTFTRTIPFDKLTGVLSAAEVEGARREGRLIEASNGTGFFLDETAGQ